MNIIRFYKVNDKYGYLSNFAAFPIFIEGKVWKTLEHYFQASKFHDWTIKEKIRLMDSPMLAASEGRNRDNIIRSDWEKVKNEIMYKGLLAKILQNHILKIELVKTGESIIVEHTINDNYWGDGGNGSGENMLGKLLMKTRHEISQYESNPEVYLPPWIAFPEIDQHDLFWRMGIGEDYMYNWSRYYLSLDNKSEYQAKFRLIKGWNNFYN
jgi:ribA/ribD-fused uncharacterized protein